MEKISMKGSVDIAVRRASGEVEYFSGRNLVVDSGKNLMASRLAGGSKNPVSHIAVGSSSQISQETNTALVGTEHERVAGTVTVSDNTFTIAGTFGAGIFSDVTVGEVGLFNAASSGDMLARFTIPVINLAANDTIDISWSIQFGD